MLLSMLNGFVSLDLILYRLILFVFSYHISYKYVGFLSFNLPMNGTKRMWESNVLVISFVHAYQKTEVTDCNGAQRCRWAYPREQ